MYTICSIKESRWYQQSYIIVCKSFLPPNLNSFSFLCCPIMCLYVLSFRVVMSIAISA